MKKVGITPAFSFRLFHLRFLCGKSKHHIEFDLIGVGISAEPVGIVTSVSSEEVFAVGTYRLIERAVVYLVIRLNRVALHIQDVLLVDRHEKLHSFLCRIGIIAYRKTVAALFDLALNSFFAFYTDKAGIVFAAIQSDVVVILECNASEIRVIS